jgi:hypothetical protein
MKRKFGITLVMMLFTWCAYSQERNFDGLWSGELTASDGDTFTITLYIEDNNVYSVTEDEDGELIKDREKEVSWSKNFGQQLNYVWMNKGGIWTETQVSSLVWIEDGKLSIHFMRHVSNKEEDTEGNSDWGYTATGFLYSMEIE